LISDAGDNPYRAPEAAIAPSAAEVSEVYAGFWRRALAWLIDWVVRQLAGSVLQLAVLHSVAPFGDLFENRPAEGLAALGAFIALALLLDLAYFAVCWHELQGSLGHLAVGARVRDAQGRAGLSWLQCIVRYFACLVSWLPFGIGFVWAAFDLRKQGWHDKIASTVVVRA